MSPLKQLLIAARALIADEDDWITGDLAKNGYGEKVSCTDPDACYLCGMGAVKRAANTLRLDYKIVSQVYTLFRDRNEGKDIPWVNDTLGHAELMRQFDEIIGELK